MLKLFIMYPHFFVLKKHKNLFSWDLLKPWLPNVFPEFHAPSVGVLQIWYAFWGAFWHTHTQSSSCFVLRTRRLRPENKWWHNGEDLRRGLRKGLCVCVCSTVTSVTPPQKLQETLKMNPTYWRGKIEVNYKDCSCNSCNLCNL